MYDQNAILRAAGSLAGLEPLAIVERIKQHRAAGQRAHGEWEATRDWKHRYAAQHEFTMERAAQHRLAIDFGAAHGWTLSTRDFGLRTLAKGKQHDGGQRYGMFARAKNPSAGDFHAQLDHPYYYWRQRKAAAIAAHLYNYPANKAECEELAARFGLDFEVPDFPSWRNPGGTTLVIYIGPAGRAANSKCGGARRSSILGLGDAELSA